MSCPNVETGLDIGADPEQLRAVVGELRGATAKPLIVKLTPNAADVPACALAAEQGGADAVSLINTLRAMALAPAAQRRPPETVAREGRTGGLSGPALRAGGARPGGGRGRAGADPGDRDGRGPDAAPMRASCWTSARRLVAVGTESFRDPAAGRRIARELQAQPAAV